MVCLSTSVTSLLLPLWVLILQLKKQMHSIHPVTYLHSRQWMEFDMTTQHDEPLRWSYRAFQIPVPSQRAAEQYWD